MQNTESSPAGPLKQFNCTLCKIVSKKIIVFKWHDQYILYFLMVGPTLSLAGMVLSLHIWSSGHVLPRFLIKITI